MSVQSVYLGERDADDLMSSYYLSLLFPTLSVAGNFLYPLDPFPTLY